MIDFAGQVENHEEKSGGLSLRRKIKNAIFFLGCETFSLTSQKGVNGHQKGQVEFADGYLSLSEPRWRF